MTPRIDFSTAAPATLNAMLALEAEVEQLGLDHRLLELVKVRASQIYGCAYYIDMHSIDARARGESEQRLYLLAVWAEAPFYDARGRAALSWIEALTLVRDGHVPDSVYAAVREHFDEPALVKLTLAVITINAWNRLCIAMRAVPGSHRSPIQRPSSDGSRPQAPAHA